MEPRVLTVLQGMVTELLPQPLLQIRTCTEERGSGQLMATLLIPPRGGATCSKPAPPGDWALSSSQEPIIPMSRNFQCTEKVSLNETSTFLTQNLTMIIFKNTMQQKVMS